MTQLGIIRPFSPEQVEPQVKTTKPTTTILESMYTFPSDPNTCQDSVNLAPNETGPIIFDPHPLCTIAPGQEVLISEAKDPHILIAPTRFTAFQDKTVPLMASVSNISKQRFTGRNSSKN